ncbi:amino acid adenylation domain-containing protein [Thermomonas sp.]
MNWPASVPLVQAATHDPFAGGEIARVVPTTEPQREVWLADRLGPDASLAFNESVSLRLSGTLDQAALEAALQALVSRHDALRANFGPDGETLCVRMENGLILEHADLSGMTPSAREAAVATRQHKAVETPFDLVREPLFRAELLTLSAQEHLLLLTAHHIVCDGWSWWVIVRELGQLYADAQARESTLPPAESFADYALAEAMRGTDPVASADEQYWLQKFADGAPVLDLPTDRTRAPRRTFASAREDHVMEPALVDAIRGLGSRRGASLFATLLAGFGGLLSRIAGQSEVVVGIPAAGQAIDDHDRLIGHCVNLLPLRLDVDPAQGFSRAIDEAQTTLLDAIEHQRLTFGALLKKLRVARNPARLPLVSVMFNIDQALDHASVGFPGLALDFSINPRTHENFEIFINAVQVRGALRLECQYNSDLFDAATMRRWLAAYEALLRDAIERPDAPFGRLSMLDAAALRELSALQPSPTPYDASALVHTLFEAQCDRTPARIAVSAGGVTLTYRELDQRANRIAHLLRRHEVHRGNLVGLAVERDSDMLAGLLGILKSGATYVPLDPQFPEERLAFMTGDAGLAALVTQDAHAARFDLGGRPVLALDRLEAELANSASTRLADGGPQAAVPTTPAYVIYTSGSTGRPKGVQVPHRTVVNFLGSMQREPGITAEDVLVAVTTLSFDIAVLELLLPICVGAQVVIADRDAVMDGHVLAQLLRRSGATLMQATPATWRLLLGAGWQADAGFRALCGGESLPPDLAMDLLRHCGELWNLYGPTEATVWSTCTRIAKAPIACLPDIHVGRPIANTRIWIVDVDGGLSPPGVPGEICIAGDGVTLGYLGRPELDAERFLPDRFPGAEQGARLYRTGDRGRWRADGNLEHLGRLDFQVKVRGYRIELGEIESNLVNHPLVAQSIVIAREDIPGDVRLVAYVVPVGSLPDNDDGNLELLLRTHLQATLPAYMVPQRIVSLPRMPLLPNGKIARNALPAPGLACAVDGVDRVMPRSDLERAIAVAMEQVLAVPGIGIHDDFFALGGHSLLAAQLTSRLNRELGVALTLRALFDGPTVAKLAGMVASNDPLHAAASIPRRAQQMTAPLSLMQERLWMLEQYNPGQVSYNTPSAHRLQGPLDVARFDQAFRALMLRQTILRTVIRMEDGTPMQVVLDDLDPGVRDVEDLSMLPQVERLPEVGRRMRLMVETPFTDFSDGPLFRARLFKVDAETHVLFFMPHHIIWDGWSFDLLYAELSEFYAALVERRDPALPELPVSYGDYADWHRQWVNGPQYAAQLAFWRGRFATLALLAEPPRALPTDFPRQRGMSGNSRSCPVRVPQRLLEGVHAASRRLDVTNFVTLLAAYVALLHGMSGYRALVVGTPVRGRNVEEVEHLMGDFTSLLPLWVTVDPEIAFSVLVRQVREIVLDSFAHPDVRMEDLTHELALRSEGGGSQLYQALFSFQDIRRRVLQWGNVRHSRVEVFQPGATEDIGMWFIEDADGLAGGLIYNADILSDATAQRLQDHYLRILEAVAADPELSVAQLVRFDGEHPHPGDTAAAPDTQANVPGIPALDSGAGDVANIDTADPRMSYLAEQCTLLLGVAVEPDDNFFDLGGNSMLAVQLADRIRQDTGVRLRLVRLASHSLAEIASELPAAPGQADAIAALPRAHARSDDWEPMWLDSDHGALYAAFHPGTQLGQFGVLVAPPLFHELPRSRRLMTEVCAKLAAHGLPCLRFDYFGTGDSAGSGELAEFAGMRGDLRCAEDALRRLAGVERVIVLTFHGGALPVASWLERGARVERAVFWEPIGDGADWLRQLEAEQQRELHSRERYPLRAGAPVTDAPDRLMGYAASPQLRRDIAGSRLQAGRIPALENAWFIIRGKQVCPWQARRFELPADMPSFGGSARMDSALFVSPAVQPVIDDLARALTGADSA